MTTEQELPPDETPVDNSKPSRFVASDAGTFSIEDPDEGYDTSDEEVTEESQEGSGTGPEAIKRILAEWEEYP